jgi:hypothetical protein
VCHTAVDIIVVKINRRILGIAIGWIYNQKENKNAQPAIPDF